MKKSIFVLIQIALSISLFSQQRIALVSSTLDSSGKKSKATQTQKASFQNTPKILDPVTVTAQKTAELLQAIPLSVTSISAKQVADYQLWNSKDISALVPNMYAADPGDKRNVISLRGISTTSYDPAMATYIDGVNQFSLDTYIAQLFDVERIEVLRGPQGSLYGRNATAGVINIITKKPENKTNGFAETTIGNAGLQRYSAGVNVPLVKNKLYFGAAYLYDQSNGFYSNTFNNTPFDKQSSVIGNFYLKYLPTNDWNITLNVKHNNNTNDGTFPLVMDIAKAISNPFKLSQNALTQLLDNTLNASISANHIGKKIHFNSQTAYQSNYRYYKTPIDGDFSPIDGITIINNYGKDWNNVKVFTQEFKLNSANNKAKFRWMAGTYYFHQNNPTKQGTRFGKDAAYVGSPDINFSMITSTKAVTDGIAAYAQGVYVLAPKLELTAGLRYDLEHKNQSILGQYQKDPNPNPIFNFRTDTSASANFHAVSPKLALSYQLLENNLLFANYSKGFRAGGLTPLSSDPSQPAMYVYQPEYSNNFELGIKNMFYNNRLMLNITAFYTTVNDAQVPTLVMPDAVTITKNTGSLTSKGIELETRSIWNNFELDYNFGYTNASYQTLKLAQNGTAVNLAGNKQIFTPDINSNLAAQYGFVLCKKQQLKASIRGEWRYIGEQYFDLANTISQASYSLFNSSVSVNMRKWSVKFWGRNLANKNYISYAYDFGAVHLGNPKTYGVTLGVKF